VLFSRENVSTPQETISIYSEQIMIKTILNTIFDMLTQKLFNFVKRIVFGFFHSLLVIIKIVQDAVFEQKSCFKFGKMLFLHYIYINNTCAPSKAYYNFTTDGNNNKNNNTNNFALFAGNPHFQGSNRKVFRLFPKNLQVLWNLFYVFVFSKKKTATTTHFWLKKKRKLSTQMFVIKILFMHFMFHVKTLCNHQKWAADFAALRFFELYRLCFVLCAVGAFEFGERHKRTSKKKTNLQIIYLIWKNALFGEIFVRCHPIKN
jgi:hypothetical protein